MIDNIVINDIEDALNALKEWHESDSGYDVYLPEVEEIEKMLADINLLKQNVEKTDELIKQGYHRLCDNEDQFVDAIALEMVAMDYDDEMKDYPVESFLPFWQIIYESVNGKDSRTIQNKTQNAQTQ